MGQVCTKNDAGKVATDAPKQIQRGANRELVSSQKPVPPPASNAETKFVETRMNFNTDKTVAKKADEIAQDVANQWLEENKDWEYTGVWKNERSKEDATVEISLFEVRKKNTLSDTQMTAAADVKPVIVDDPKDDVNSKRPVVDQKQSFVDQVSEGLEKKIPKERFEQTAPETPVSEEKKQEAAPAAEEDKEEEIPTKQVVEDKPAAAGLPLPATGTPPNPVQDVAKDDAGQEKQPADTNSEAKDQTVAAAAAENAKEDEHPEQAQKVQEEAKAEPEEEKAGESAAPAQNDQEEAKADDEADGEEELEVEDPGNKDVDNQQAVDNADKEKDSDSVVDGLGADNE